MIKFGTGSALDVLNPGASLNVGSRSYINGFDQNNDYGPLAPVSSRRRRRDPTVLFTSIYDDTATTSLVPNPINVTNETPPSRRTGWCRAHGVASASRAAESPSSTRPRSSTAAARSTPRTSRSRLSRCSRSSSTIPTSTPNPDDFVNAGTFAYITNNNFYNNFDAAMQIEPNGLMAGNPLTPLSSGNPFLHGNVMTRTTASTAWWS